jgi:hypothetical protein
MTAGAGGDEAISAWVMNHHLLPGNGDVIADA